MSEMAGAGAKSGATQQPAADAGDAATANPIPAKAAAVRTIFMNEPFVVRSTECQSDVDQSFPCEPVLPESAATACG